MTTEARIYVPHQRQGEGRQCQCDAAYPFFLGWCHPLNLQGLSHHQLFGGGRVRVDILSEEVRKSVPPVMPTIAPSGPLQIPERKIVDNVLHVLAREQPKIRFGERVLNMILQVSAGVYPTQRHHRHFSGRPC